MSAIFRSAGEAESPRFQALHQFFEVVAQAPSREGLYLAAISAIVELTGADAVAVLLRGADGALRQHVSLPTDYSPDGVSPVATLPLSSGEIQIFFHQPHQCEPDEIAMAETIAAHVGLREQAEAAGNRAAFLTQAGLLLASSLNYQDTLAAVARLAVPVFADWAAIDIANENGELQRIAVTRSDPEKAGEFHQLYAPSGKAASIVMQSGESLLTTASDEQIDQEAGDPEQAHAIRQPGIVSVIVTPMRSAGTSVGLITFATSESGRVYTEADRQTADELGRRAALAVAHARLQRNVTLSEERFRAIVDTTPECVKVVAPDGSLRYINTSGLAMVGASSADAVVGQSVFSLIAPEFRESYRQFHESVCRGEKGALEFEIVSPNGRRRMSSHSVPLRNPDGTVDHLAIARDITETSQAERAALLLSAIVGSSDDAIISKDLNGIITSWNASAQRLFGYTAAEAVGRPVAALLIPADRQDEEPKILSRLRRGERVDHFETVRHRKDGSLLDISLTISPVKDAAGHIIGASKIARDISAQKRAEERMRFMAESMPQKIFTSTPTGEIDYLNAQWMEYTGLTFEEIKGWGWTQFVHPEDLDENLRLWRESTKSGEPFHCVQRFRRADGFYRWHLSRALPMRDPQGHISMWIGSNTDIHEQKEIEEDLRRANADLEQFAFSASHDLQEPLRTVNIYSELLEQRYGGRLSEDGEKFLRYVRNGATRMEALIRDLLAYTQVAKFDEPVEQTDAQEALAVTLSDLGATIAESGADISAGPMPCLPVHRIHLQQLFQNIIGNALKYRDPERPPVIRIAAERRNGPWTFSISDNGIGIDPAYKENIFGLFKRLHTSDQYSGTGIGLAICHRIVDRYHGRIWVESEPGRGSTFFFTLPAD